MEMGHIRVFNQTAIGLQLADRESMLTEKVWPESYRAVGSATPMGAARVSIRHGSGKACYRDDQLPQHFERWQSRYFRSLP
jgi:hypothetical protein